MACYRAIEAWQCENNKIVFNEIETRKYGGSRRVLYLPCGRCIGCRIVRTKEWATRCMNEAQLYDQNCFVTLTYDKDPGPSLRYKDFQKFMREVRKKKSYFDVTTWSYVPRFFMSGEYGESNGRPHFHALLFGRSFQIGVLLALIYIAAQIGEVMAAWILISGRRYIRKCGVRRRIRVQEGYR